MAAYASIATIVELYGVNSAGDQRSYRINPNVAVSYGSLMVLSGDNATIAAATIASMGLVVASGVYKPVGIAAEDISGINGQSNLSVYTNGRAMIHLSGAGRVGDRVFLVGANQVSTWNSGAAALFASSGQDITFGTLEQTGSDAEYVQVRFFS